MLSCSYDHDVTSTDPSTPENITGTEHRRCPNFATGWPRLHNFLKVKTPLNGPLYASHSRIEIYSLMTTSQKVEAPLTVACSD